MGIGLRLGDTQREFYAICWRQKMGAKRRCGSFVQKLKTSRNPQLQSMQW